MTVTKKCTFCGITVSYDPKDKLIGVPGRLAALLARSECNICGRELVEMK